MATRKPSTPGKRTNAAGRRLFALLQLCSPSILRLPSMQLETAASQERLNRFSVRPHPALGRGKETSAGRRTNQHGENPPHTTSRPMDSPPDHDTTADAFHTQTCIPRPFMHLLHRGLLQEPTLDRAGLPGARRRRHPGRI
ncbi:hypothetical protein CGRA01v4_00829 [Colletotrichum graminicola]|nr:hypothetical protein CGRA01v4_00829 [Colletotrichum graminicola]